MKKFIRISDRNPELFPEAHWRKGYSFYGKSLPEYDQVEEIENGVTIRIHSIWAVKKVQK